MKYFRITITALALILGFGAAETYAATFTVTNTSDSGAGSLRQAILDANINSQDDEINFDSTVFSSPQTITLTSGNLFIGSDGGFGNTKSLTINGPGADKLTINGNNNSRIFRIESYGKAFLHSLKMINGNGTDNGPVVDYNAQGGGILVEGGGLPNGQQNLVLTNSIISDNTVTLNIALGGGILLFGRVTIINSAIVNNFATQGGGAIMNPNGEVTIINSTVSNNSSYGTGGIRLNGGFLNLINSTVAFNLSINGSNGGINTQESQYTNTNFYAKNSIIAKNIGRNGNYGIDIWGPLKTGSNNIIGNTLGTDIYQAVTNTQINLDPQLDTNLRLNGGIIPNHALSAGSLAIDNGDNCVLTATSSGGCLSSPITADQRGAVRPQDGDGNGTATVDIGAFEATQTEIANTPGKADLRTSNDTGISDSDNITKSRDLTFDVSNTVSGATVEFYRNGVLIGSVVASGSTVTFNDSNVPADGVFSYDSRQIINGVLSLYSANLLVTVDNTVPAVTVNQSTMQFDPTTAQPLNFVAVFNEAVIGFDSTDVSLAQSTAGVSSANINLSGNGPTYNISVSGIFPDGIVRASVPANTVQDVAGNSNAASTSTDNSITLDNTAPTVTINQAAAQADPTRNMPVNFTVIFSEPVTGFNNADISLTGSTASIGSASVTVTGSGAVYNVAVSGLTSNGGFVTAAVRPQAASDAAGNQSVASTSTDNVVTVDNTSPTVTLNQAVGQVDPTSVLPINFTVVFSEPVTGFEAADISFTGSTVSTTQAAVTITGSGTTYNVSVGGTIVSNGGSLQVRIVSGAAQDVLGNLSFASTSTDNIVRIDNVSPTVTINQAIGQSDPASTQPVNFTVVFSEIVTGLTASDISLSGSTANVSSAVINVTGSGNVYTVSVSSITSSGQVRASVIAGAAADALGNPSLASTSSDNTVTVSIPNRSQLFDFDGDRKTDISIFRPGSGEWWYSKSSNNQTAVLQFGLSTDKLVPTDFTGDGKTDIAVWRGSTGEWFILRSEDNSFYSIPFGAAGDIPAVGDFDGDGRGDLTVFRPSTSTWFIQRSSGGFAIQQFGINGDVPVVGDYDGDGRSDLAIFRPAVGEWWYRRSSDGQIAAAQFGLSTDKPVQGDYTGDGKTDIAFWRPGTGEWFVLRSENGNYFSVPFGTSGDTPSAGDYDGDGKFDFAVFRPSDSTWYIQATTAGTLITTFGSAGDVPVPAAFVP